MSNRTRIIYLLRLAAIVTLALTSAFLTACNSGPGTQHNTIYFGSK